MLCFLGGFLALFVLVYSWIRLESASWRQSFSKKGKIDLLKKALKHQCLGKAFKFSKTDLKFVKNAIARLSPPQSEDNQVKKKFLDLQPRLY